MKRFSCSIVCLSVLCLLLLSCGNRPNIPQETFTNMVYDFHLAAITYQHENVPLPVWSDSIPYNYHIVERYGYTQAEFDTALKWYSRNAKHYMEVYQNVLARLETLQTEIEAELPPPAPIRNEVISNNPKEVVISSLMSGDGEFVAEARMRVRKLGLTPPPDFLFTRAGIDTAGMARKDTIGFYKLIPDGLWHHYKLKTEHQPQDFYTLLEGHFMRQNNLRSTPDEWTDIVEIDSLRIMFYPKKYENL